MKRLLLGALAVIFVIVLLNIFNSWERDVKKAYDSRISQFEKILEE